MPKPKAHKRNREHDEDRAGHDEPQRDPEPFILEEAAIANADSGDAAAIVPGSAAAEDDDFEWLEPDGPAEAGEAPGEETATVDAAPGRGSEGAGLDTRDDDREEAGTGAADDGAERSADDIEPGLEPWDETDESADDAFYPPAEDDNLEDGDAPDVSYIGVTAAAAVLPDVPTGGFSDDVAVDKFDSLDRACLGFAVARGQPGDWAVDLGSGMGLQGLRLALSGMNALLVDMRDLGDRVDTLREIVPAPSLHVLRKDLRNLEPSDLPRPLRLAHSQRTLHFLSYEEALRLLAMIAVALEPGGRAYLSAAGLNSAMGRNYAGQDLPVSERYGLLAPAQARSHDIHEPVCLYATDDLRTLGIEAGLSDVRVWPSEQGNVKGIFEKR
jgi:hypothetical protein